MGGRWAVSSEWKHVYRISVGDLWNVNSLPAGNRTRSVMYSVVMPISVSSCWSPIPLATLLPPHPPSHPLSFRPSHPHSISRLGPDLLARRPPDHCSPNRFRLINPPLVHNQVVSFLDPRQEQWLVQKILPVTPVPFE